VGPALLQIFTTTAPLLGTIGNLLGGLIMTGMTAIGTVLGNVIIPAIEMVVSGVLNFANTVAPLVVSVIEGIVGTVTSVINAIISAINFVIEKIDTLSFDIPDWVPLVGGKHIGFNFTPLPLLAAGGFTNGPSIAGEAGTEAVISFKPSERAANLANWMRAGQMLGALDGQNGLSLAALPLLAAGGAAISLSSPERTASLANWIRASQTQGVTRELREFSPSTGTSSENITFAPQLNFYGSADKEQVQAATRQAFEEFKRMYRQMKREESRTSLARAY